jgi:hypothetical protein
MEVILVMVGNLQEYILDNIFNLKKFNNNKITVITDDKFKDLFPKDIRLEIAEEIDPNYINYRDSVCNLEGNGFWEFSKYRFYLIALVMKKYNLKNICHIENDVLIYRDLNTFIPHCNDKILLTIDSYGRCIPGIMFIPSSDILLECFNQFTGGSDMYNLYMVYEKSNLCDTLPIFITDNRVNITKQITRNFKYYNCIFDAAAIGQYLGGINPCGYRSSDPDYGKPGKFVNETCIYNYSKFRFIWKESVPYMIITYNSNTYTFPIFNLHIHCKDLKKFIV